MAETTSPGRARRSLEIVLALLFLSALAALAQQPGEPAPAEQLARFHHVHINAVDPEASINFYASHFKAEKAAFAGTMDAVRTDNGWLFFEKVDRPAPRDILSSVYHIGWGAVDMRAEYERLLAMGATFETPLTDGADLFGTNNPGRAFFAYVEGPDGELIEINTTNTYDFQHLHLLSDDPVSAAEWYMKHFGAATRSAALPSREPRVVNGLQVFPMVSVRVSAVNVVWFPKEFARGLYPEVWRGRTEFESPRGRVIDHFAFSVDNLDDTLARLQSEGVRVIERPRLILEGKLRSAFIEGPDKVHIELVQELF